MSLQYNGVPNSSAEKIMSSFMLNVGDTAQPYQPYTTQKLPIPTPDGLPGIPVTSGGNWVDESGQQWVSDVVDLAAEIKTQNVYALRVSDYLDGLARTSNPHGDTYYITTSDVSILTIPSEENSRLRGMLCNYFEAGLAYSSEANEANEANFDVANIGINGRMQNIRFCFGPIGSMPTLEDAKAWFEAHDVIVMYPLATPSQHHLTPKPLPTTRPLPLMMVRRTSLAMKTLELKLKW